MKCRKSLRLRLHAVTRSHQRRRRGRYDGRAAACGAAEPASPPRRRSNGSAWAHLPAGRQPASNLPRRPAMPQVRQSDVPVPGARATTASRGTVVPARRGRVPERRACVRLRLQRPLHDRLICGLGDRGRRSAGPGLVHRRGALQDFWDTKMSPLSV